MGPRKELRRLILIVFVFYSVGYVLLCAFVFLLIKAHKTEIARTVTLLSRNSLVVSDFRSAIIDINNAAQSQFLSIKYGSSDGQLKFTTPPLISQSRAPFWTSTISVPIYTDSGQSQMLGKLDFTYSWRVWLLASIVIWPTLIAASLPFIRHARLRIERRYIEDIQREQEKLAATLAKQVAHDIRSPLSALEAISNLYAKKDQEVGNLIKDVSIRIKTIANDLLDQTRNKLPDRESSPDFKTVGVYPATSSQCSKVPTTSLADAASRLVREKNLEYSESRGVRITYYNNVESTAMVRAEVSEFSRILSNLINNSVEALEEQGFVSVSVEESFDTLLIHVRDNGKGIPEELLSKVTEANASFGKANGNGLGLAHAKKKVDDWQGSLSISSTVNQGTTISIQLPFA